MAQQSIKQVTSQSSFSGGVNASVVPLIASERNPNGLGADQLAWAINCTMRDGGISPRPGWTRLAAMPNGQFMDAEMYAPINAYPYIISMIAGQIYQHRVDTDNSTVNLSAQSGQVMPITTKGFMAQGEEFLVIQAGDYETLPLFWDGMNLMRSRGYVSSPLAGGSFAVPAIGDAVLISGLTTPWDLTDPVNQIYMIEGYRYQQITYNQKFSVTTQALNPDISFAGPPATSPIPFATNLQLNKFGSPGVVSVIVVGKSIDYVVNNGSSMSGSTTQIFMGGSITPFASYYLADYVTNGRVINRVNFQFANNALAVPGANQVWMVNLDDTRTGTAVAIPDEYSQLPAGGPMDYYMGRMWVANGTEYLAGDIVGGSSGTGPYNFRDAILNIEENAFLSGGGTFAIPTNAGNITALKHNANLDTALGQGLLFPFTRKSIYSVNVPPDRATWDALEEPLQRVAQINFGTTSDRSVVPVNGDLFYRAPDGLRSLIMAIRYFGQWGNTPVSREVDRVLNEDDQLLMDWVSGVNFDNRLLTTCLPVETGYGVAYRAMVAMNFDGVSTMRSKTDPAWEGIWEGLDIFKTIKGDFGGVERTFAFVRARTNNTIELWELSKDEPEDTNAYGTSRITWIFETPAYDWGNCNALKELDTLRFWIDRVYGKVDFTLYYRNDQNPCWNYWNAWSTCAARNDCENPSNEFCEYPTTIYKQQYRAMMTMPKPPVACDPSMDRPTNIGYSFQFRLVVKGSCRVRGLYAYAFPREEQAYPDIVCPPTDPCSGCPEGEAGSQGADGARGVGMVTYFGAGDPNGVQSGNQGDAFKSDDGTLWHKSTVGGLSGWI